MSRKWLISPALVLLLAACGGQGTRPPGPPPPPPPPPPTNTFGLSATPSPMALARGGSAPLTVTVTFNNSSITRVRLTWVSGSTGVVSSQREVTVTPAANTAQFQITNNASANEARPFFYIYGNACTSNTCNGQEQRSIEVRTN